MFYCREEELRIMNSRFEKGEVRLITLEDMYG